MTVNDPPVPTGPTSPAPSDVTARIRAMLPGMSPAEARICQIVAADPGVGIGLGVAAAAAALTVNDLAALASSSTATVVRAARRLGFDGYPQLRLALAAQGGAGQSDVGVPLDAEIEEGDGAAAVLAKLAAFESEQIRATAELVDPATLDKVVGLIRPARRIDVYGIGASGLVAQDLAAKLSRIGLAARAYTEHDAAMVSACLLSPADLAVGISHSGETSEPSNFSPSEAIGCGNGRHHRRRAVHTGRTRRARPADRRSGVRIPLGGHGQQDRPTAGRRRPVRRYRTCPARGA